MSLSNPARGLSIALLLTPALAAQAPAPDLRSCTPSAFTQQSGIPLMAVYLDGGGGLAVGRDGVDAPFVASLQGSLLWSPSAKARRWALGPVVGLSYANPQVHGMFGGRVRYRVLPIRIHEEMDLGLGIDLFADGIWETPSAGLFGLGGSLDLPLDIVVPVNGPRLFTRILRDTERDDWRFELGFGIRPWRRLATNPRTPAEPARWRFVISSIQGAIEAGVVRRLMDSAAAPGTQPIPLCDYTQLRAASAVLATLRADAARPGSTITSAAVEERFAAAGLREIIDQLNHPANSWRQQFADALAQPPPMSEPAAVSLVAERVRAAVIRRYRLGGSL